MCVTWTLVVRVRGALSAGWAMVSTLSRVRAQFGCFSLEREMVWWDHRLDAALRGGGPGLGTGGGAGLAPRGPVG